MRILRVFVRRTSYTPTDPLAHVGPPPLMPPWTGPVDEVHISCVFTWQRAEAERLAEAWRAVHPVVRLGGPAFSSPAEGFTPGLYVREGVTHTSRGCPGSCSWCLVPEREGPLRLIDPVPAGYVVADNNLLACPTLHRSAVWQMLGFQRHGAVLSGGLQSSLVTDEIADEIRGVRISDVFLAADTEGALRPLQRAVKRLAFLGREKLRCYVLCGYDGETIEQAEARLVRVWEIGALPFCQLYQPVGNRRLTYSPEWRRLQKTWSRPAMMRARMRGDVLATFGIGVEV